MLLLYVDDYGWDDDGDNNDYDDNDNYDDDDDGNDYNFISLISK